MARVVVVGFLKGGTGKTTTAMHLACGLADGGRTVHLLDGDPTSQSAYDWAGLAQAAGDPLPFATERYPFEDVADRIATLRGEVDDVVVDAGGGGAVYLEESISAADLMLATLAPEAAETRRVVATLAAATRGAERNRRPEGVSVLVVLTRSKSSSTQRVVWRRQLAEDGHPVADTEIRDLVQYSDAYGTRPSGLGDYAALLGELELTAEAAV